METARNRARWENIVGYIESWVSVPKERERVKSLSTNSLHLVEKVD